MRSLTGVIAAALTLVATAAFAGDVDPRSGQVPDQASDHAREALTTTAFGVKGEAQRAAHAQASEQAKDAAKAEAQKSATGAARAATQRAQAEARAAAGKAHAAAGASHAQSHR